MTLQQYCTEFDSKVFDFTGRRLTASDFHFDLRLGHFYAICVPAGAVAMLACRKAGFVYTGMPHVEPIDDRVDVITPMQEARKAEAIIARGVRVQEEIERQVRRNLGRG